MAKDRLNTEIWMIIGYNLLLLFQVFVLKIPAGNILLVFWVENALLGVVALVSLLRARRGGHFDYEQFQWDERSGVNLARWPAMWVFGYGMFTGVALAFLVPLAYFVGVELTVMAIGIPVLFAIGRETGSALQSWWLAPDQQLIHDRRVVADAKSRMIVLHLVVLFGFGALIGGSFWLRGAGFDSHELLLAAPLVLLVVFKAIGEVLSVLRARRIVGEAAPRPATG